MIVTFWQDDAHFQHRHQVVYVAVDALRHPRILQEELQKVKTTQTEKQRGRTDRDIEHVRVPGSSWLFLYRLSTPHDAPGRWKLQRMVCLQRTIVSLASLVPAPPLKLSTDGHKYRELHLYSLQETLQVRDNTKASVQ